MTNRALLPVVVIVIAPLLIATWILATHTVGESLSPSHAVSIGFAVALLAVMPAGYFLILSRPPEVPNARFGIGLVVCGTSCVLVALALQFYLAFLASENSRRLAELMGDSLKRGERVNVNLNTSFPETVKVVAYLALGAGIWFVAMGVRIGGSRSQPAEEVPITPTFKEAPIHGEEAIRQAPR